MSPFSRASSRRTCAASRTRAARPFAGLTPKGKLLYVGRVVALPDRFLLILEGPGGPAAAHLARFAAFQNVTVRDATAEYVRPDALRAGFRRGRRSRGRRPPAAAGRDVAERSSRRPSSRGGARRGARRRPDRSLSRSRTPRSLRVEAGRALFGRDADESCLPDEVGIAGGDLAGQGLLRRPGGRRAPSQPTGRSRRRLVGFRFPDAIVPAGTAFERTPRSRDGSSRASRARPFLRASAPSGSASLRATCRRARRSRLRAAPERVAVVVGLPFA